jgi:hypothetical protein
MNNYRSGIEVITGNTPDISHLLYFDFYQPVYYLDELMKFPHDKEQLGRWLGPVHSTGQALCYYVINVNGNVLACSTVRPVKDNDILFDILLQRAIQHMDAQIEQRLGPAGQMDDNIEMGETQPRYVVSINEAVQQTLLGTHVLIPENTNGTSCQMSPFGTVVRTIPAQGYHLEGSNQCAVEDRTVYEVEFDSSTIDYFSVNAIAASLYDEASGKGDEQHQYIDIILSHTWVDPGDDNSQGQWFFEVLWGNGSITWESLQHLRRIDMTAAADYAVENDLQGKQGFGS